MSEQMAIEPANNMCPEHDEIQTRKSTQVCSL